MNSSIANGEHYKNDIIKEHHVGQPLDPAMISDIKGNNIPPLLFLALKKILEPGKRGNKSFEQDISDAIGALNRQLELHNLNKIQSPKDNITSTAPQKIPDAGLELHIK